MHLYRQLPSPPHENALAGFVESVTGVCETGCSMHGDCIDGVCDCYRRWRGTD